MDAHYGQQAWLLSRLTAERRAASATAAAIAREVIGLLPGTYNPRDVIFIDQEEQRTLRRTKNAKIT